MLLASLLALSAFQAEAKIETPVDVELTLAVDISRSINPDEALLQRQGYIEAFRDPGIIRAIRSGILGRIAVAYFEWSGIDDAEIVADWTLIDGAESAHAFAAVLERVTPGSARRTSISGAIEFALSWFDGNGFEGTRQVIDISGDGPNNWGALVTTARDRAVARRVTINGLPILDEGGGSYSWFNIPNLDLYYRDCVIGGPGAFLVVAADFKDFARAVRRKLILEIAGRAPRQISLLHRAQARRKALAGPPCDIGEQMMRDRDDL